jgi:hypothetical protein
MIKILEGAYDNKGKRFKTDINSHEANMEGVDEL